VGEPITLSGAGVATVGITGVTFASLLQGTDAGVFIGAFAGAVVYVLSANELSRWVQVGFFIASFFIGVLAADMTTGIIAFVVDKYIQLPPGVVVSKSIGATVAASIGVYVLINIRKLNFSTLASAVGRIFSGGGNGNPK
jgi:hypothetical protein